jgi:hypothetical protein
MAQNETGECTTRVTTDWGSNPCGNKAKSENGAGMYVCGVHSDEAYERREGQRKAKRDLDRDRIMARADTQTRRFYRDAAFPAMLNGFREIRLALIEHQAGESQLTFDAIFNICKTIEDGLEAKTRHDDVEFRRVTS